MSLYRFRLPNNVNRYVYAESYEAALRVFKNDYDEDVIISIEELREFRDNILIQTD